MTALLEIDDLSVIFRSERGEVRAVSSVSLKVDAGETLAIVGESGSGKSVTALSILRLLGSAGRVARGSICFEGENLVNVSDARMRATRGNRIAMIFQEPMSSLNPTLTIGRQVAEPIRLHRRVSWDDALSQAARLLEMVAIPDAAKRLRDYPHQFSGGMRQRVMIAMALACQPRLLIADEPTTALDVTVQAQILDLLKSLTRDMGVALVLITHDLGLVARYADRVAVMYAGRVVETAPVRQLFQHHLHPYTRGLMTSTPGAAKQVRQRLHAIAGQPPDLAALPPGCAFAPRCSHAHAACLAAPPAVRQVGSSHFYACVRDG
jgi:oligopeptide transport system ATP-binding protein